MKNIITLFTAFFIVFISNLSFSQCDTNFTVNIKKFYVEFDFCIKKDGDLIREITYSVHSDDNIVISPKKIKLSDDDFAHYIEFDDYNFDGYLDMYVHDPCMILGNCFGKVYLFRDVEFKHDPQLDDLTTVTADPNTKTIFSSNRSAAGSIFTNETFKWEGDSLILIKRVSQDYAPGYESQMYIYKVEELNANGNLVVTKQEYVQEPYLE